MLMMDSLKPIAFDVLLSMSQLFEYYMYAVYMFFGSTNVESSNPRFLAGFLCFSLFFVRLFVRLFVLLPVFYSLYVRLFVCGSVTVCVLVFCVF